MSTPWFPYPRVADIGLVRNVLHHGAIKNGSQSGDRFVGFDNTNAFERAMEAATANGEGVFVPPGQYYFPQPGHNVPALVAPSRVSIYGVPGQSIILLDHPVSLSQIHSWWIASANYADDEIPERDIYEYFRIYGITFRGLWREQVSSVEFRYTPLRIFNYESLEVENCRFENIYGAAMLDRWNGRFYASGNVCDVCSRAGIHSLGTPDVTVTKNYLRNCEDDSIALQSLQVPEETPPWPELPQRGKMIVSDNIIESSEGIHISGANHIQCTGNVLRLCFGTGVSIGLTGGQAGAGAKSHIQVSDNVILNQLNRWFPDRGVSGEWGADPDRAVLIVGGGERTKYQGFDFIGASASAVSVAANTITSVAHGIANGTRLLYDSDAASRAIGGLTHGSYYYAVNVTADTLQLSLTAGGAAIDITSLGTAIPHLLVSEDETVLLEFDGASASFVDLTNNTIDYVAHGLANDTKVIYISKAARYAIGGLTHEEVYYIVNAAADTFQFATEIDGDPIDLTALGTAIPHRLALVPGEYMNSTNGVLSAWGFDTSGATVPAYGWLEQGDEATNPSPGSYNIVVKGNIISRTLPLVDNYEDWEAGSYMQGDEGFINPPITDDAFRDQAILLKSEVRNALVADNVIFGFRGPDRIGIIMDVQRSAYFGKNFQDVTIRGNRIIDTTVGITTNRRRSAVTTAMGPIIVENNNIACDPFVKSSRRTAGKTGTWTIGASTENPVAIDIGGVSGWVVRNNTIGSCYFPIKPSDAATRAALGHIEANVVVCQPAVAGAHANNKGVADVPLAGPEFRHVIWGSDPTLATWNTLINNCPLQAAAMPSSGTWVAGAFVQNTAPALAGGTVTIGWSRLTTGSAHVEGTDWAPLTPNSGFSVTLAAAADGAYTAVIPENAIRIRVTSSAATNWVVLPSGANANVGRTLWIWVGNNGFELVTPQGSNATINNVDADGTNQVDIGANTLSELFLVATDTWILRNSSQLGAVNAALVPDND